MLTAYGPRWISNTDIVFGAKGALWRTTTTEGAVPAPVPYVGQDGVQPAVSRPVPGGQASRLAYVRSYADSNVWRVDVAAAGASASSLPAVAIASTRTESLPQLSPDGRRVVFNSTRSGENEIWVADLSGANAVQVTSLAANPGYPSWSPDGSTIVFQTNSEEVPTGNVFVVSAEGGRPRRLTSGTATSAIAMFSSDGRWIYYQYNTDRSTDIRKIPAVGGEPVRVVPAPASRPTAPRDGAFLYYVETFRLNARGALWRQAVNGGERVKVLDGVLPSNYALVDDGVYYTEPADGDTRLRHLSFATGRLTTIVERLGTLGPGLSASRDGRTILFTRIDAAVDDLMLVDNFR
jgi:dipeptidyl aminopeptidase/acylaminoacyl peptidase